MAMVDVRLSTVDGSVTVEVSGRPFGGRVCATTTFTHNFTLVLLFYKHTHTKITLTSVPVLSTKVDKINFK